MSSNINALYPIIKDKLVEISIGEEYEQVITNDANINIQSTMVGYVKDLLDDFLVLDCFYFDKDGNLQKDNRVYVNTIQIMLLSEVNQRGSLNSVMNSTLHTNKIKRLLGIEQ